MWSAADISCFFSLFQLKKDILDSLLSREYTKNDLNHFTETDFQNFLGNDQATARVMYMLWSHICSYRHCAQDALEIVKETIVTT